ncbi:MAG: hypothetical protein M3Y55_16085 [Pseudomonadota bacterium]|nr:hypothetical protein [Pseudomonadota bacterium]
MTIGAGLFRCARCDGFKTTAGRRQVLMHGLKAWACVDCHRPDSDPQTKAQIVKAEKPWRTTPRG